MAHDLLAKVKLGRRTPLPPLHTRRYTTNRVTRRGILNDLVRRSALGKRRRERFLKAYLENLIIRHDAAVNEHLQKAGVKVVYKTRKGSESYERLRSIAKRHVDSILRTDHKFRERLRDVLLTDGSVSDSEVGRAFLDAVRGRWRHDGWKMQQIRRVIQATAQTAAVLSIVKDSGAVVGGKWRGSNVGIRYFFRGADDDRVDSSCRAIMDGQPDGGYRRSFVESHLTPLHVNCRHVWEVDMSSVSDKARAVLERWARGEPTTPRMIIVPGGMTFKFLDNVSLSGLFGDWMQSRATEASVFDKAAEGHSGAALPPGRWVTIRGRHIYIREGKPLEGESAALQYRRDISTRPPSKEGIVYRVAEGEQLYYIDSRTGERVDDDAILERINKLVVPPGWSQVWIDTSPSADLVAKGKDEKGRNVYLYSDEFRRRKDTEKWERLKVFQAALPRVRKSVMADLDSHDPKTRDVAAVLYLIDLTSFRVGGERDTRASVRAYGATTLRPEHVYLPDDEGSVHFSFTAKKGVKVERSVKDETLARIIRERQGRERLFHVDENDVIRYLRRVSGEKIKTHDFRMYHATRHAAELIAREHRPPRNEREFRRMQRGVAKEVAQLLGNTPSVALSSYIAPFVWAPWEASARQAGSEGEAGGKRVRKRGMKKWLLPLEEVSLADMFSGRVSKTWHFEEWQHPRVPRGMPGAGRFAPRGGRKARKKKSRRGVSPIESLRPDPEWRLRPEEAVGKSRMLRLSRGDLPVGFAHTGTFPKDIVQLEGDGRAIIKWNPSGRNPIRLPYYSDGKGMPGREVAAYLVSEMFGAEAGASDISSET